MSISIASIRGEGIVAVFDVISYRGETAIMSTESVSELEWYVETVSPILVNIDGWYYPVYPSGSIPEGVIALPSEDIPPEQDVPKQNNNVMIPTEQWNLVKE